MSDIAAGWSKGFESSPVAALQVYEDVLVPSLFTPWANLLIDALAIADGASVLDVACGPGAVARLAAERVGINGRVVGCDISPAMLAIARAKPKAHGATIEYRESPAAPLDAEDASFDAATCQHGLQFFPDRDAAVAEMRRALRPGGRVGIAVWSEIDGTPMFAALASTLREVFSEEVAAQYVGGPWGFSSIDDLGALLTRNDFVEVRVERRELEVTIEASPTDLVQTLSVTAAARNVEALDDAGKQRLLAAAEHHLGPFVAGGRVRSLTTANIATARKP